MNSESSTNVLTRQWRIAEIAKQHPERSLNCIHHHLDLDWLRVAYGRLTKDKAPGYDAQTVRDYGNDLDRRLTELLTRVKGGNYCAPPVKRVRIPKGEGKETRPIGIPTTEIRFSSARWRCYWNRYTRRSSLTSPMDFDQDALRTKRYSVSGSRSWMNQSNG